MRTPEPQKEHEWLRRLIGEWTWESEEVPGHEHQRASGTERVRMLGEYWAICEGSARLADTPHETIMTIGFDPAKSKYVGTFVASAFSFLWLYGEGARVGENRLELFAEGPSFTPDGGTALYRDAIELVSENERTLTSHVRAEDGSWTEFMRARYRRAI